jgi:hypothetical protein
MASATSGVIENCIPSNNIDAARVRPKSAKGVPIEKFRRQRNRMRPPLEILEERRAMDAELRLFASGRRGDERSPRESRRENGARRAALLTRVRNQNTRDGATADLRLEALKDLLFLVRLLGGGLAL